MGLIEALGGRAGPKLERVEFPAFGEVAGANLTGGWASCCCRHRGESRWSTPSSIVVRLQRTQENLLPSSRPYSFLWGPRLGASPELGGTHVEGTPGS